MNLEDRENNLENLKTIENKIKKLMPLFTAIGLDYVTYIDIKAGQDKIFELRDNVNYRFYASRFLLTLLINHINASDKLLTQYYRKSIKNNDSKIDLHLIKENLKNECFVLFDSLIFNLISLFDYTSNLIEYCCDNQQKKLKWTQLARKTRGNINHLNNQSFSNLIDKIDREFVGRLYDHRSYVIHNNVSFPSSTFSIDVKNAICKSNYIAPKKFVSRFFELKKTSKIDDLSLEKFLFWLINKSIEAFEELVFGIKETMEINKKYESGHIFYKNNKGEFVEPSKPYWDNYKKLRPKANNQ